MGPPTLNNIQRKATKLYFIIKVSQSKICWNGLMQSWQSCWWRSFQITPVWMLHTGDSCSGMVTGSVCPPNYSSTSLVCMLAQSGYRVCSSQNTPTLTVMEDHQHMGGTGLHNALGSFWATDIAAYIISNILIWTNLSFSQGRCWLGVFLAFII